VGFGGGRIDDGVYHHSRLDSRRGNCLENGVIEVMFCCSCTRGDGDIGKDDESLRTISNMNEMYMDEMAGYMVYDMAGMYG
jgi:hypothetical protein